VHRIESVLLHSDHTEPVVHSNQQQMLADLPTASYHGHTP
jgi:hypothetical protein